MKLYIKQKFLSLADKYDVYDANQNLIYDVKSEFFTIGAKIHINDIHGQELYYIKQRITFMWSKYEIYKGNILCAVIKQQPSFFRAKISIDSAYGQFEVNGDIFDLDYEILKDGRSVGVVHKKFFAMTDNYEMDIPEYSDPAFFATLVIAIDNARHNNNNSGN